MWLVAIWQDGFEVLDGWPNTHWAGDSFVLGSRVLQYWRMVYCRESVEMPLGSVLLISHLAVFTPISALQFECGNATDERQWCTPHSFRNCV